MTGTAKRLLATSIAATLAATALAQEDWAAVEAAAKQEGALVVYSTTSRTETAANAFSELTGIQVEVTRLGEQDLIQRAYQEGRAGAATWT